MPDSFLDRRIADHPSFPLQQRGREVELRGLRVRGWQFINVRTQGIEERLNLGSSKKVMEAFLKVPVVIVNLDFQRVETATDERRQLLDPDPVFQSAHRKLFVNVADLDLVTERHR